jgi:hypothetical protein
MEEGRIISRACKILAYEQGVGIKFFPNAPEQLHEFLILGMAVLIESDPTLFNRLRTFTKAAGESQRTECIQCAENAYAQASSILLEKDMEIVMRALANDVDFDPTNEKI